VHGSYSICYLNISFLLEDLVCKLMYLAVELSTVSQRAPLLHANSMHYHKANAKQAVFFFVVEKNARGVRVTLYETWSIQVHA
jgi:hypothetical protein